MKQVFYSDSGKPCWKCSGTIAEYTTDTEVSLIDVICRCCHRRDVFRPVGGFKFPETAAEISAAHRSS
jgi:hypothetical protein